MKGRRGEKGKGGERGDERGRGARAECKINKTTSTRMSWSANDF